MAAPDVEEPKFRSGFLVGPWQLVALVLIAPWLLVASAPTDDSAERWLLVALGGLPIVILLVIFGRGLVFVGRRGLWTPTRGWTAWSAVVQVKIEEIDERVFPIEAPVLRLEVPLRGHGPGSHEQLTGLAGYRVTRGNRRARRQADRICSWALHRHCPMNTSRRRQQNRVEHARDRSRSTTPAAVRAAGADRPRRATLVRLRRSLAAPALLPRPSPRDLCVSLRRRSGLGRARCEESEDADESAGASQQEEQTCCGGADAGDESDEPPLTHHGPLAARSVLSGAAPSRH